MADSVSKGIGEIIVDVSIRLFRYFKKRIPIILAPSIVICGPVSAGKTSLVEILEGRNLPTDWDPTLDITKKWIIYYSLGEDDQLRLKNIWDMPGEMIRPGIGPNGIMTEGLLGVIKETNPKIVLVMLDGNVIKKYGVDGTPLVDKVVEDKTILERLPSGSAVSSASEIFDHVENALLHNESCREEEKLGFRVITIFVNKADDWQSESYDSKTLRTEIISALKARRRIREAIDSKKLLYSIWSVSLRQPSKFETQEALHDLAQHSANLSQEKIGEAWVSIQQASIKAVDTAKKNALIASKYAWRITKENLENKEIIVRTLERSGIRLLGKKKS